MTPTFSELARLMSQSYAQAVEEARILARFHDAPQAIFQYQGSGYSSTHADDCHGPVVSYVHPDGTVRRATAAAEVAA